MDAAFSLSFAREWVTFWNGGDIDQIMTHYAKDVEMYSPLIKDLMNIPCGCLKGKEQLRAYFLAGLQKYPENKFRLIEVFHSLDSLTILFEGATKKPVAETLFFDEEGKVNRMIAHYQVAIEGLD